MEGKWLFGWTNIKWGVKEIVNIYSNRDSFFSKKRIESGIAFIIAEWGMIFYLLKKLDGMDIYTFGGWAVIQFAVAGYMVKQIQKEKSDNGNVPDGVPLDIPADMPVPPPPSDVVPPPTK